METDATPTGLRLLPKLTIASGNVGRIFPNSLRCETATTPLGLLCQTHIPRVDAKRVNPGLSCITASRLKPETGLRKISSDPPRNSRFRINPVNHTTILLINYPAFHF